MKTIKLIPDSLIQSIYSIVGKENLLLDSTSIRNNATDAFGKFRDSPTQTKQGNLIGIVKPSSSSEVQSIVVLANQHGIPIVPHGGGTGVMGAITPTEQSLSVDLRRMNHILSISPTDKTATIEAGVILGDLDSALKETGLMLGHDPYSVPIATVGGAISTNGVGYRATKYGSMGEQVLGLQVVMPSGELLNTRPVKKSSAGPSLKHLFIGAEGTLGIITQATIKVFEYPETRIFKTISFDTFEEGFHTMLELFSIGIRPAMIDLSEEAPEPTDQPKTTMFLMFEGYKEEVHSQIQRSLMLCKDGNGKDIGEALAKQYWYTRHDSAYSYKKRFLDNPELSSLQADPRKPSEYPHVALPASKILEYRSLCKEIATNHALHIREYSSWTEPELFSMILVDVDMNEPEPTKSEKLSRVSTEMLSLAQQLGGSMEYVHGVGTKLAALMPEELNHGIDILRTIKSSLDPNNIMNPGRFNL
jgi:alkyldihydroxyacetonephosphate synthase